MAAQDRPERDDVSWSTRANQPKYEELLRLLFGDEEHVERQDVRREP